MRGAECYTVIDKVAGDCTVHKAWAVQFKQPHADCWVSLPIDTVTNTSQAGSLAGVVYTVCWDVTLCVLPCGQQTWHEQHSEQHCLSLH